MKTATAGGPPIAGNQAVIRRFGNAPTLLGAKEEEETGKNRNPKPQPVTVQGDEWRCGRNQAADKRTGEVSPRPAQSGSGRAALEADGNAAADGGLVRIEAVGAAHSDQQVFLWTESDTEGHRLSVLIVADAE